MNGYTKMVNKFLGHTLNSIKWQFWLWVIGLMMYCILPFALISLLFIKLLAFSTYVAAFLTFIAVLIINIRAIASLNSSLNLLSGYELRASEAPRLFKLLEESCHLVGLKNQPKLRIDSNLGIHSMSEGFLKYSYILTIPREYLYFPEDIIKSILIYQCGMISVEHPITCRWMKWMTRWDEERRGSFLYRGAIYNFFQGHVAGASTAFAIQLTYQVEEMCYKIDRRNGIKRLQANTAKMILNDQALSGYFDTPNYIEQPLTYAVRNFKGAWEKYAKKTACYISNFPGVYDGVDYAERYRQEVWNYSWKEINELPFEIKLISPEAHAVVAALNSEEDYRNYFYSTKAAISRAQAQIKDADTLTQFWGHSTLEQHMQAWELGKILLPTTDIDLTFQIIAEGEKSLAPDFISVCEQVVQHQPLLEIPILQSQIRYHAWEDDYIDAKEKLDRIDTISDVIDRAVAERRKPKAIKPPTISRANRKKLKHVVESLGVFTNFYIAEQELKWLPDARTYIIFLDGKIEGINVSEYFSWLGMYTVRHINKEDKLFLKARMWPETKIL